MSTIILDSNDKISIGANSSNVTVIGGAGTETVIAAAGVVIKVDQNIERTELSGASSSYTYLISGNVLTVKSGATTVAEITGGAGTKTIAFSDGSAPFAVTGVGAATLGGQSISASTAGTLTIPAAQLNTSDKSASAPVAATPTPSAGQTFTLTTGVDQGAAFTGGTANDTFNGTGATLGAQDVLNGGAGTDTLKIVDTTSASAAGLTAATITDVEALEVASNAGLGAIAVTASGATTTRSAQAEVITLTPLATGTFAATDVLTVTIGSAVYTTVVHATTAGVANAGASIAAVLTAHFGNDATGATGGLVGLTTTAADGTTGVVTVTSLKAGTALPAIIVTSATAADTVTKATTTANLTSRGPGAIKEVLQVTVVDAGSSASAATDIEAGTAITVSLNGVDYVVPAVASTATAATATEAAANVAQAINAALGTGVAVASGAVVTVTAPVAGTPLPYIGVKFASATDFSTTYSSVVANQEATVADSGSVTAVVYNAAGFADAFTASGAGDMNVKAASTAAVKLSNTSGKIVVDTAKTVDIVTTGSGTTDVTGKTLETVSIKGGGNVTVDNLLNTSAATTAAGTSMTTATLTGIAGTTAALKGAALSTVNITSQTSALTTTVTNGTSKALTLNLTASGYNSSGTAQTNRVNAGAAAEAITVNTVSKSNVDVRGAAVTALTLTGAGELTAAVDNLATRSITSTATGDLILGTLNAATTSVTTGAGADSFTLGTAVKTVRVSTGEGKDVVTIGQLVAGATVDLGAGDDKILGSGVVEAKTVSDPGMIDGGAGSDTISSLLINQGNASRFANFEVLGLATASATFDATLVTGVTGLELLVANSGVYTGVTKEMGLAVNANMGSGSTTLTYAAANVVGTSDSMTVTFGAKGETTSTSSSRTSIDGGTLVVEGIENINIVSNQASGFVNNTIDLTSAKLKTVTITGNAAETTLGFTGTVGTNGSTAGSGGAVSLIDASTVSGIVTVSTAGITADDSAVGLTIKTGSGKDSITLRNMATVDGGAADDAFVLQASTSSYNSANSILTGGAGKDSYDVSAIVLGTDNTAAGGINNTIDSIIVTITDYAAGDTIDFSAGAEDAETLGAAVSTATTTTLDGAITAIIVGAGTTHFAWGVYAGNTYVAHNADKGNSTDTAAEAGDVVVKLSGVYDLSLAAFSTGGVMSLA